MAFAGVDTSDFFNVNGFKKNVIENVTSHKIAVVVFIKEFSELKKKAQEDMRLEYLMSPIHRRDFCILVLKLIQSPDLEFTELEALLTSGKYNLINKHLEKFCFRLKEIYDHGVNALIDSITQAMDKLMMEDANEATVCINKSSVAGIFIRKMMVFMEKLSFSQVTAVYRSFCTYYESGRPGSLMRCLSKDKLNLSEVDFPMTGEEKKFHSSMEKSRKYIFDKDRGFEQCQWSRKQAELLTAKQAALLQGGEPRALSPPTLQKIISNILRDNPDYAEAHFLSYMNCLRSREFCGAMDSLYSCFDHTVTTPSQAATERNKVFRYASLNLAILHALFGHKDQVMSALKEAMIMSQEAGDSACLQQAACWAWWIGHSPPPSVIRHHPHQPHIRHRAAMQAQVYVQHSVTKRKTPAFTFNIMMKADIVHCQNSLTDLMQTCIANRAALWAYYGKSEMAFVCCQLLLNLNTGGEWDSESSCLAACGMAQILASLGQKAQAASILQHARTRAPSEPLCLIWMRTQHLITASYALMAGKWQEVEQAAQQLSSIDRWESQLIRAELHFLKREPICALKCLNDILDNCTTEEDSKLRIPLRIKAMVLAAQVENSSSGVYGTSSTNITFLNEALALSVENYLDYQAAIIEMHIANVQLQLGCITNALSIVQRVLSKIMAHGGLFDQGRAMLLYVKCRIASAPKAGEIRKRTMMLCSDLLETVKEYFNEVDAISRLKDVIYLQAQVYNEIGNTQERNKCALEYRNIDEQHPTKLTNELVTCF